MSIHDDRMIRYLGEVAGYPGIQWIQECEFLDTLLTGVYFADDGGIFVRCANPTPLRHEAWVVNQKELMDRIADSIKRLMELGTPTYTINSPNLPKSLCPLVVARIQNSTLPDCVPVTINGRTFHIRVEPTPDAAARFRYSQEDLEAMREKLASLDCPIDVQVIRS